MPVVNLTDEQVTWLVSLIENTPIKGTDNAMKWNAISRRLQAVMPKKKG
jgi:hypothetical protein